MDLLAEAINNIKTGEISGKDYCAAPNTALVRAVLDLMREHKYIKSYEASHDSIGSVVLKVGLSKKINGIGVVRPRYAARVSEYQKYETRYIPSKDFGILIVSTSEGVMTNRTASERGLGGRLLAYVY